MELLWCYYGVTMVLLGWCCYSIAMMLLQDEVGWSPRGQSRRLIVVITDGDYHYALDGKVS